MNVQNHKFQCANYSAGHGVIASLFEGFHFHDQRSARVCGVGGAGGRGCVPVTRLQLYRATHAKWKIRANLEHYGFVARYLLVPLDGPTYKLLGDAVRRPFHKTRSCPMNTLAKYYNGATLKVDLQDGSLGNRVKVFTSR